MRLGLYFYVHFVIELNIGTETIKHLYSVLLDLYFYVQFVIEINISAETTRQLFSMLLGLFFMSNLW